MTATTQLSSPAVEPGPYFADLYTFHWTGLSFETAAMATVSVALALVTGVLAGHPSAGLIAGAGAMTVGMGMNQRILDSRLWPMLAATALMAVSTFVGMLAGHTGYGLVLAATVWAFVYGLLTSRAAGVAWVGQQAVVTLVVTSAFPASPVHALQRAGLTLAGGTLQIFILSAFMHLLPELKRDVLELPRLGHAGVSRIGRTIHQRRVLRRLRELPQALPHLTQAASVTFALRMAVTVGVASEVYRRLGMQSGYWVPMTALLVQKPAFFETLARALLRIGGTLAGAVLATLFLVHFHPDLIVLALLASFFVFWAYATNAVNYGLFSFFLTSYIVFLLSLNATPGPQIAHRRAYATLAGGLIALIIHVDGLRRHKANPIST